jgi:tRNA-Thr(GGU) m(6)t(6)A37 methyltransferase TsaA
MRSQKFIFQSIGIIHTPHKDLSHTPIQPVFSKGIQGSVELFSEYVDGLKDLDGFSHIYLFYYFDRSEQVKMRLKPYLDVNVRGVFATRAPHRPNKIGMSLVRLLEIRDNILEVEDVDILDRTPLLDIKPYIKRFDSREEVRSGWQDNVSDDIAFSLGRRDNKVS